MNHQLFKLNRKLLMLTIEEAAANVGQVAARTWKRWEYGHNRIPDDVLLEMAKLSLECRGRIAELNGVDHRAAMAELKTWQEQGDELTAFDMRHKIEGVALAIRLAIN